jgi:hypothetical protein
VYHTTWQVPTEFAFTVKVLVACTALYESIESNRHDTVARVRIQSTLFRTYLPLHDRYRTRTSNVYWDPNPMVKPAPKRTLLVIVWTSSVPTTTVQSGCTKRFNFACRFRAKQQSWQVISHLATDASVQRLKQTIRHLEELTELVYIKAEDVYARCSRLMDVIGTD